MNKLICRPYPEQGESLTSYVHRLTTANTLKESEIIALLNIIVGQGKKHDTHPKDFQRAVVEITGHKEALELVDMRQMPGSLLRHIRRESFSCCPTCMREAPYHRAVWLFREYTSCPKHGEVLIDTCAECESDLTFPAVLHMRCTHCGARLKPSTTPVSSLSAFPELLDQLFQKHFDAKMPWGKVFDHVEELFECIGPALLLADPSEALFEEWRSRRSLSLERIREILSHAQFPFDQDLNPARERLRTYYQERNEHEPFGYNDFFRRFRKWMTKDRKEWLVEAYLWNLFSGSLASAYESEIGLEVLAGLVGIERKKLRAALKGICPDTVVLARGLGTVGTEALRCIGGYLRDQGDRRFVDWPV